MRDRHAHAWTQVYIDGKWQTFDTTPPSWIAIENNAASNWQYVRDLSSFISFQLQIAIASIKSASRLQYLWLLALTLAFILFRFTRQRQTNRTGIEQTRLGTRSRPNMAALATTATKRFG